MNSGVAQEALPQEGSHGKHRKTQVKAVVWQVAGVGQAPHAGDSFRGRDSAGGDGGAGTDLRWEQSRDAVSCGCLLAGGGTECPEEAEGTGAARGHGHGHSLQIRPRRTGLYPQRSC